MDTIVIYSLLDSQSCSNSQMTEESAKTLCNMQCAQVWSSVGLPWWLSGKESAWKAGNRKIPELVRSPGGGQNPLQYSCLENPHGQRSLVGYSPRDHKESDMNERLSTAQQTETRADDLKLFSPHDSRHWNSICTNLCFRPNLKLDQLTPVWLSYF